MDALLLAAYAASRRPGWQRLADLGCGAGAVALGALVLAGDNAKRYALGLDLQPELVAAASHNAALLGFDGVFEARRADFMNYDAGAEAGCFDVVAANPPYRLPGEGRLPPSPLRRAALFAGRDNLAAFVRAGRMLLAPGGAYCLVFPAGRADELVAALGAEGLAPEHAMPVAARQGNDPSLVLLSASASACGGIGALDWREQKTLVLYEAAADGREHLSRSAIEFCKFLSCNSKG